MKKLSIVLVMLLLVVDVYCYSGAFKNGDKLIQGGIGFGYAGAYGDIVVPPISISYDQAVQLENLPLSFGGLLGFAKSEYDYSWGTWTYT